jgi:hypothetical protein
MSRSDESSETCRSWTGKIPEKELRRYLNERAEEEGLPSFGQLVPESPSKNEAGANWRPEYPYFGKPELDHFEETHSKLEQIVREFSANFDVDWELDAP